MARSRPDGVLVALDDAGDGSTTREPSSRTSGGKRSTTHRMARPKKRFSKAPLSGRSSLPPQRDWLDGGSLGRTAGRCVGILPYVLRARTMRSSPSPGDFESGQAKTWIKKYFGSLPRGPQVASAADRILPDWRNSKHITMTDAVSLARAPSRSGQRCQQLTPTSRHSTYLRLSWVVYRRRIVCSAGLFTTGNSPRR